MLRRHWLTFFLLFTLCYLFAIKGFAQNKIAISAKDLSLSTILNTVSSKFSIRFAYNEDLFSQIQTSIEVKETTVDAFLNELCGRFGLKYKLIGGTYVIFIADEIKVMEAIQITNNMKQVKISTDEIVLPPPIQPEFILSGIVKNQKTGEKLNYCSLKIDSLIDAISNEMGYFSALVEPKEEVRIQINHLGYQEMDTIVKIQSTTPLNLQLKPIEYLQPMRSIGFRRNKFIVALPEVPEMIVFNPKSTLQLPALESNDLMNALTVIPGINYLKGTETGLSIRGGAPSDNLVLIDGIPVIETSHLMGNLSVLNAKYIQQAFVSRGGFGAEYGGRTSGIVDLTGKSGNSDVTVVDFTANQLHTNIYVGLPINEKSSLAGSFKKSFVDIWSEYLIKNFALENKSIETDDGLLGDGKVERTVVNYTDANLKLSIRPSNRQEMTFNYFSSYDSQLRDYSYPVLGDYLQNNSSESSSSGYSFNYKTQNQTGWLNTFSLGYHKLKTSSSNKYIKTAEVKDQLVKPYYDDENIAIQELRVQYKSEFKGRKFTHQYGVSFNYNQLDVLYEDHEIKVQGAYNFNDSILAKSSVQLLNSYYQLKFLPTKWLSIRGGVRGLYNLNNGYIGIQPRYGIELIPSRNLKFHYSGGRYLQNLYLAYRVDSYHNVSPIWFIPTDVRQNLDAFHHIIGSRLELRNVLLNVEAYQKINSNKIYFIGEPGVKNGLKVVNYSKHIGEEMNRGVDVFMQYQTKIFKHLLSYSISQSFEEAAGINDQEFFPSFDHQLHRLRLTEIIDFGGFTASVNWYYASGAPYLLNTSSSSQLNFDAHPDFMQLDVSLVKQFHFKNFFADLGITVLNVSNRTNEIGYTNFTIPEGTKSHRVSTTTIATSFSPLFYVNLRYE
ncbi:MAG: TonB-dependent receptor plug domain-containing protein [Prolixibacteraceae bacterium]